MRLKADGLAGERGGERIFSGVGFILDAGTSLTVTGPNGAGKSTLLRVLAGLLPAAAGNISFEGGGQWPALAGALHYLGHQNAMKAALTVSENLRFWQDFCGMPRLSAEEALGEVGLEAIAHLPFGYLSTGQRRRAAIARLLVSHRPVWLLDEPTAGLDKASEQRFSGLMNAHLENGGIIVAATHLPLGLDNGQTLAMRGEAS
ncbi:cytochrome c biogenesis ATP-binding export protein CcmA [Mesorhizobium sp. L-8-10]|uniref:heme ABC exporter ATP-binding protein CcmA n=1 Tax=unclassified Mesorhizobium TaxID=325217 RepID=UPI001926632C|nr:MULTISPECIES: heme ABC exporter ATP-binding protein CcmA [unclassified Mesorhizobium]BCH22212.1 cytochrome c biogenesis ATP-binding export protein CcmA [Mesorhizobium sp. L-8-3]BCH30026.1 cytochrome c biogenesis ATP-binding export protein CcmA [Mesorhizobium sp. L-8-10]